MTPPPGAEGPTANCPRCRSTLSEVTSPGATATVGQVMATLPPRVLLRCPRGHRTEPREVRRSLDRLPSAGWRAFARPRCGACGTQLDLPSRRTTRSVTVEPAGGAPYTLELTLPLVRCPDCAVENVPVEVRASLLAAIRLLLR